MPPQTLQNNASIDGPAVPPEAPLDLRVSNHVLRQKNQLDALSWINGFRWLRTVELGRFLWPDSNSSDKQAARLAHALMREGLVLRRPLPERAGHALVLSAKGARLLRREGAGDLVSDGTAWGSCKGPEWRPNGTWRHDLRAASALSYLHVRGCDVWGEHGLRMGHVPIEKWPDGIVVCGEKTVWVEVEREHKKGVHMRKLAEELSYVAGGKARAVGGRIANTALVLYVPGERVNGRVLNHRQAIVHALEAYSVKPVDVQFGALTEVGPTVAGIEFETVHIVPDRVRGLLKHLEQKIGWVERDGQLEVQYGNYSARIYRAGQYVWCQAFDDDEPLDLETRAPTITAAKTAVAAQIVQRMGRQ